MKKHRAKSRRALNAKPLALNLWNQDMSPLWHTDIFANQKDPLSLHFQKFYWGLIMRAWLMDSWAI